MATNEAIILKTYALLLYLVPIVGKFPRDQKFLVGDRIENKVLDILDLFIEAYYSPKSEKARLLKSANMRLRSKRFPSPELKLSRRKKPSCPTVDLPADFCGGTVGQNPLTGNPMRSFKTDRVPLERKGDKEARGRAGREHLLTAENFPLLCLGG